MKPAVPHRWPRLSHPNQNGKGRNKPNRLTPTIDFIDIFPDRFTSGCKFHDALGVRLGVNFGETTAPVEEQ